MVEHASFNSIEDFERQVREVVELRGDRRIKTSKNTADAIKIIRKVLEESNLRYRVYTSMRATAATAATAGSVALLSEAIPVATALTLFPAIAVLGTVGIGATVGIAAHRIVTRNPDYEFVKYPLKKEIILQYKTRIDVVQ